MKYVTTNNGRVFCYIATKIPLMYSFSMNSAASAPISTFMCLIYIVPGSVYLRISSSRVGKPSEEIYNAWMWKLELRPQYSFSGNICFEISVFCLCSVVTCSCSWCIQNTYKRAETWKNVLGLTQDFPLYILFLCGNLLFTSADLVSGLNIFSLLQYISLQYQEGRVSQLEKAVLKYLQQNFAKNFWMVKCSVQIYLCSKKIKHGNFFTWVLLV
jgi:hypothetical protein